MLWWVEKRYMANSPKLGFNTEQQLVAAEDATAGETLA
eukprot:SAG31_NODE_33972_length_338_cov_0.774059_1_plen_37_part_10